MKTVKLIASHPGVEAQAKLLSQHGVTVDAAPVIRPSSVVTEMASLNPDILVLDLDKLPFRAREISLMLRSSKSARHIPLLFVGSLPAKDGLPEKFARLRVELPDVPYVLWPEARAAIARLLAQPATAPPMVPAPRVYTATLAQKLGVVSRAAPPATRAKQVALIAAPDAFLELLGELPEDVVFSTHIDAKTNLAVCFIRSMPDLAATIETLTLRLPPGTSAWIAYPKTATHKHPDFSENDVRNVCLAAGLVDYKICSIDADWSAIKFARRRKI